MRAASVGGHWLAEVVQMRWSHANETQDQEDYVMGHTFVSAYLQQQ